MPRPKTDWQRLTARLLLAAGVLAASLFQAPAVRHVHAGGDKPHHHHGTLQPPIDEAYELEFARCDSCGARHDVIHGLVPHLHLVWLGFEIMIPEGAPHRGLPHANSAQPISIVRLNEVSRVLAPGVDSGPLVQALTVHFAALPGSDPLSVQFPSAQRQPTPLPPPLCDVARHERSGVQLA